MGIPTNFVSLPTVILGRNLPVAPVLPPCPRSQRFNHRAMPKRAVVVAGRGGGGGDYVGRSVDEGMLVLRKRLQEMKAAEMGHAPPSDWMEWEKSYYDYYVEDVCGAVGLLQRCLMNVRPSLGLGVVALVAMSVPVSTGTLMFRVLCTIVDGFSSS